LVALQSAVELFYDRPPALRGMPGAVAFAFVLLVDALLFAAFAGAFWWSTGRGPAQPVSRRSAALLILQLILCLTLSTDLLFVVAAEIPFVLRGRAAVVWLTVQGLATVAMSLVLLRAGEFVATESLAHVPPLWRNALTVLSVLAWQGLAFAAGWIAATESRGRRELARVNAELLATQELLADSSRLAERLHISRELHDSLGHHLAALSVNLELAGHLAEGRAAAPVQEAHTLARLLLGDVREVVGALRESRAVDLPHALRTLAGGSAGDLHIHITAPDDLEIRDPAQAHALFRCAQEAITNTLKHARARNLWIELSRDAAGLAVEIRDDGRGCDSLLPGNGLRGMKERLAELGGRLEIESQGPGFTLRARLPVEERPA
jgi:signal transduction histidine kinase